MIVLRLLGRLFLTLALALLGLGVALWLAGQEITTSAGALWYELHVPSLQYFQVVLERHLGLSGIWQDWIQNGLLQLPAWDAILRLFVWLMILAGILLFLGRDRNKPRHSFRSKR